MDLNAFLDESSTMGGTWSGGEFVVNNTFDPSGLISGVYTVTYGVGEGECLATASTDIVVEMSTSIMDVQTNFIYQI